MSVTLNRSSILVSRMVLFISFALFLAMGFVVFDVVELRRARDRLLVARELTDEHIRLVIASEVASALSNRVPVSAGVSTTVSSPSVSHQFAEVSTWQTVGGSPRCMIDGGECGVGDYCQFGLVVSIRPRRVICRGDDGKLLVVAHREARRPPDGLQAGGPPRIAPGTDAPL